MKRLAKIMVSLPKLFTAAYLVRYAATLTLNVISRDSMMQPFLTESISLEPIWRAFLTELQRQSEGLPELSWARIIAPVVEG